MRKKHRRREEVKGRFVQGGHSNGVPASIEPGSGYTPAWTQIQPGKCSRGFSPGSFDEIDREH
jgi:hypothetical protein